MQLRNAIQFELPAYIEERAHQIASAPPRDCSERVEFTEQSLAIDDPTTSEVDDAIRCVKRPEGGWTVTVHVADPAAYVHHGDPIDLEALNRCAGHPNGHIAR